MRASMAALGTSTYDPAQVAGAIRYIAIIDRQPMDDGTYSHRGQRAEGRGQSAGVPSPHTGREAFLLPSPSALAL